MDKIDLAKYYIVIYFPNRPWKKYYFNRLYCPMEGIGRMEEIDKVTIQRILKSFKNSFYKSKTKTKHNQETGRRLNFIYVREHI